MDLPAGGLATVHYHLPISLSMAEGPPVADEAPVVVESGAGSARAR